MEFCECKSGNYRWRDVAMIKGEFRKVDESVSLIDGDISDPSSTFDISPIIENLAKKYDVREEGVILASFDGDMFPDDTIVDLLNCMPIGGYCAVCGGEV